MFGGVFIHRVGKQTVYTRQQTTQSIATHKEGLNEVLLHFLQRLLSYSSASGDMGGMQTLHLFSVMVVIKTRRIIVYSLVTKTGQMNTRGN